MTLLLTILSAALALSVVVLLLRLRDATHVAGAPDATEAGEDGYGDQARADEILERMSDGVVVLDDSLKPVLVNRAARTTLGLHGATALPARLPSDDLARVARRARDRGEEIEEVVGIWYPQRRHLRVAAAPLAEGGGVVVVLTDVTGELQAQRIRREFVANASHELKSPVASLHALAEAVHNALPGDVATARRFSMRAVEEAERLGRLIADLLDLSRLEDSVEGGVREAVDISAVVGAEIEAAVPDARAKKLHLVPAIETGVKVLGDGRHLSLIVRNLLDNAIRYTPEGGSVEVALDRKGSDVHLIVSDTGMGIPREAQERIFERFFRVDKARSRDRGGTGLGLAIVKHAVELHQGTIYLDSELGSGSRFTVSLPAVSPGSPGMTSRAG